MNFRKLLFAFCVGVAVAGCKKAHPPTDLTKENLIPVPVSVQATADVFEVTKETSIYVEGDGLLLIGEYLANKLRPSTGFLLKVSVTKGAPKSGNIYITTSGTDETLGAEGYELTITEDLVTLAAAKPAGAFRGIQTVRQLLPYTVELSAAQQGPWEFSTGTIRDYPTYPFSGSMLDVARHFFSVEDVKRYIDLIAGTNEVLPPSSQTIRGGELRLSHGRTLPSWRKHGSRGREREDFIHRNSIRILLSMPQDRYVTIIPEIDLPGHTNAALASYPELNCNGKAPAFYTGPK